MTDTLKDKVALVTGASRGIGAATAITLAKRGAKVAITYGKSADEAKTVVAEIEKNGGKAIAIQADAAQVDTLDKVFETIKKEFGGLDILVNNAGVYEPGDFATMKPEVFERTFNVNVKGVVYTTHAALGILRDGGRVINIGSILSERGIFPGQTAYATSKFAVAGFSRALALDLAPRKITVNVVQPGPIDTAMNPANGESAKTMSQMVPLKRYGTPQEIANTVAFLASDDASYITGATLNVDGGVNA